MSETSGSLTPYVTLELFRRIPSIYSGTVCSNFLDERTVGGGVAFIVRNYIGVTEVVLEVKTFAEIMALRIKLPKIEIDCCIVNVYRPIFQINPHSSPAKKHLDLVFTTNRADICVSRAFAYKLLDRNSTHHMPLLSISTLI